MAGWLWAGQRGGFGGIGRSWACNQVTNRAEASPEIRLAAKPEGAGQTKGEGEGPARVVASPRAACTPPPLMSQRKTQRCRGEKSQGNKNAINEEESKRG